MAKEEKKEVKIIMFPEGRVINHSLFELDKYNEEAKPKYTLEVAFEPDDLTARVNDADSIEDELAFAGEDEWGAKFVEKFDAGATIVPFKNGDEMAAKREEAGKPGDAYKGKTVIRFNTIYNKDGVEGPGGAAVFLPDTSPVTAMTKGEVYQGCYGIVAATIWCYKDERTGKYAQKFYLSAFQKTRDGEKLVTARDHSKLFKPVGRSSAGTAEGGGRRTRKG